MPLPPLSTKQNPRVTGSEVQVNDEPHVIGEDTPNFVWLDQLPFQAVSGASVTIPSFTELLPAAPGLLPAAPGPGEFRVFYDGIMASAVEFNAADNGQSIAASYLGRGGIVVARDYNRIVAVLTDLQDTQADFATLQADFTTLQGTVTTVQGDLATLQGDVTTVQGAVSTLQGDFGTLQTDVGTLQTAVQTTQESVALLQQWQTPVDEAVEFLQLNLATVAGNVNSVTTTVQGLSTTVQALDTAVQAIPATYVAKGASQSFDIAGTIFEFETDAENVAPFQMTLDRFDVNITPRKNNVMRWGYNITSGGGRVDPTKHSLALEIESYFHPNEVQEWTEAHLAFTTVGGRLIRPWTMQSDIAAGDPGRPANERVRLWFNSDDLSFNNADSTDVRIRITEGGMDVYQAIRLAASGARLMALNSAGNHMVTTMQLDSSNNLVLGELGYPIYAPAGANLGLRASVKQSADLGTNPAAAAAKMVQLINGNPSGNGEVWTLAFDLDQGSVLSGPFVGAMVEDVSTAAMGLIFGTRQAGGIVGTRMRLTSAGSVLLGGAAVSTSATAGYPYITSTAGTPTGTPTSYTGLVPMVVDSTNSKLCLYIGGAWKSVTLT